MKILWSAMALHFYEVQGPVGSHCQPTCETIKHNGRESYNFKPQQMVLNSTGTAVMLGNLNRKKGPRGCSLSWGLITLPRKNYLWQKQVAGGSSKKTWWPWHCWWFSISRCLPQSCRCREKKQQAILQKEARKIWVRINRRKTWVTRMNVENHDKINVKVTKDVDEFTYLDM